MVSNTGNIRGCCLFVCLLAVDLCINETKCTFSAPTRTSLSLDSSQRRKQTKAKKNDGQFLRFNWDNQRERERKTRTVQMIDCLGRLLWAEEEVAEVGHSCRHIHHRPTAFIGLNHEWHDLLHCRSGRRRCPVGWSELLSIGWQCLRSHAGCSGRQAAVHDDDDDAGGSDCGSGRGSD